jgi:hypothetical protein
MGGMFSVIKVRDDVRAGEYKDPGWYRHPQGAVAYEYQGDLQTPARVPEPRQDSTTLNVRKPSGGHSGH